MRNAFSLGMALCLTLAIVLFGAVAFEHAVLVYAMAGLLAVAWATKLFSSREVTWNHSPMHWAVLAFLVYALVDYWRSPLEHASRIQLFHIFLYGFAYFFAAQNLAHRRERTIVISVLLVVGTLQAMLGIGQVYTHAASTFGYERPEMYLFRASGTYICPNHLAGLLEMLLGLGLAKLAFQNPKSNSSIQQAALKKLLLGYAVLVMLAGILHSLSRGGWIASAVGILAFLVWSSARARSRWPRIAVGLAVGCVFALLLFNVAAVRNYIVLTFTGQVGEPGQALNDPTLGGRTFLWQSTAQMIKDHPVLGTGGGTWNFVQQKYRHPGMQFDPEYAHNDVLQLVAEYGFVGLALVLAVLGCFYWQATRIARHGASSEQRAFGIGTMLAVSMILVHSWFDFNLHIPANALLFSTLLGMVAGIELPNAPARRVEVQPVLRYALAAAVLLVAVADAWRVLPTGMAYRQNAAGMVLKRDLQWDEAKERFHAALRWDPNFPAAHCRLGEVSASQAKFRVAPEKAGERDQLARQAIQHFEAALRLNPYHTEAILRLGAVYELTGDDARAKAAYERATSVDPNSARPHVAYGVFLRKRGEDALADAAFEKSRTFSWWADRVAALTLEEIRLNGQAR